MRFVLGNRLLDRVGGTEVHLLTFGSALQRLGHEVTVYSPQLGAYAEHLERRGLPVTDRLRDVSGPVDVLFAQDTLVAYELAERWPEAFHVFRVCGETHDFQLPPQEPGVVDLVLGLSDTYLAAARACAESPPTLRLRVPIDTDALMAIHPIRPRPRRAVLLGNYEVRDDDVAAAWAPFGIEVGRIGGSAPRFDLADALAEVDIVVAKSRAVLDAMACGRAVYVLDAFGGDGWVTPQAYPEMEAGMFAGQATGRVITPAELAGDIALYDPGMGRANRDLVVQHHDARRHAIALLEAIERRRGERPARPPVPGLREISRLTALQWSWEGLARDALADAARMTARVYDAEARAEATIAAAAEATEARAVAHLEVAVAAAQARVELAERRAEAAEATASSSAAQAEADREDARAARELAAHAEARAEAAEAAAAELRQQLTTVLGTRTWRAARRFWWARAAARRRLRGSR